MNQRRGFLSFLAEGSNVLVGVLELRADSHGSGCISDYLVRQWWYCSVKAQKCMRNVY